MKVPVNWVKDYTDINVSVKELADMMTMTGSKVEEIITLGEDISNVVVGRILSVDRHPDADKLVVCSVDVGQETVQIVTGAPNVEAGQLVPVALHGARLPGGVTIKRGKLRGVESQGMLCSGEELMLKEEDYPGAGVNGILILKEDYAPGMDIKEALDLGGEAIDFEITSNRPDCLSIIGIAREIAITCGTEFRMPEVSLKAGVGDINEELAVRVENPDLCPRYMARVVKDVKVGPSPQWMRRRLAAAGIRPINNIVDITNYVMLEMGQPMHAFDIEDIEGRTIVVRNARPGETIKTLDDKDRQLTEDMLVIADVKKPIAVAGVMGGANSEITEKTKCIVFESALFNAPSVRLTSKALGLRSESSMRFEKGLDINTVALALDRAAQLVQELGAGTVVNGMLDVLSASLEKRTISVRWNRINELLGLSLTVDTICGILARVGIETDVQGDTLTAVIPTYRNDIEGAADLAEEVARVYGYDKIPMTLMEGSAARGQRSRKEKLLSCVKNRLTGAGLYEVVTYSFTSPDIYRAIGYTDPAEYPQAVKIANPLGEDQSIMRRTLLPSILEVLSRNYNRRISSCRIFEINPVFLPKSLPLTELPDEVLTLAIGEYGNDTDFYTLKGVIEEVADLLGLGDRLCFERSSHPALHHGRTAQILLDGKPVGFMGEVHPKVLENFQLDVRSCVAELDLQTLLDTANTEKQYKALPRFPAVNRDLALIVDKKVTAAQIEKVIKGKGGKILEVVELFDIYEGKQIPEGCKSMAYSLTYRASDRTLVDDEVNAVHQKIVNALEAELGARLR